MTQVVVSIAHDKDISPSFTPFKHLPMQPPHDNVSFTVEYVLLCNPSSPKLRFQLDSNWSHVTTQEVASSPSVSKLIIITGPDPLIIISSGEWCCSLTKCVTQPSIFSLTSSIYYKLHRASLHTGELHLSGPGLLMSKLISNPHPPPPQKKKSSN